MDFVCFCCDKSSENHNEIIRHLRSEHRIRENDKQIHCIKNHEPKLCNKFFFTFSGLRNHLKACKNIKYECDSNEVCYFCI